MKTINLLPGWYRQHQRRQNNIRVHVGVMLVLGTAMVATTIYGRQRLAEINHRRDALAGTLHQFGDPEPQLRRMKADLQRLEEVRLTRRELGNTIPMSAVIQQLQNDMTPGMALASVAIEVRPEPVRGSGFVGDTHNPPRYHDVAHLNVIGIAPNDVQIAQLIDKVSKNPLFTDVTLDFTRTGELQRYPVRKFEIQMNMDLERLTAEAPDNGPAAAPLASGVPSHGD